MLILGPPADRQGRREWWRRQIQRQRNTGVPVAESCRRLGLQTVMFYAWRRRLGEGAQPAASSLQTPPKPRSTTGSANGRVADFVPVAVVETTPTTCLEVTLGNADVVRVHGPVDPQLLGAAIHAAGELDGHCPGVR
jgi:hypothetical protein